MNNSHIISARQLFAMAFTIIGIFFSQNTQATETVCKLTMCGRTYSDSNILPKMLNGETQTIRVFVRFGNFVQSATAGITGISATIGEKEGGGIINPDGCETWVDVTLNISPGVEQNGVVISLFGLPNTLNSSFRVNVYRKPTISSLAIRENEQRVNQLVAGRTYKMTVSGNSFNFLANGLSVDDEHIISATKNGGALETAVTYDVVFDTNTQIDLPSIRFRDEKSDCHYFLTGFTDSHTVLFPKPDLIPSLLIGKYNLNSNESCGGSLGKVTSNIGIGIAGRGILVGVKAAIGAPSTNAAVIIKEIIWPNIQWSVKNTGGAIIGTFKVQLKSGSTVLQEETVTNMDNNETKTFTYTRPKSKKKLMRILSCNNGDDVHAHQDNATNPDYNWADPAQFTIKVDALNNIAESNENNNQNNY